MQSGFQPGKKAAVFYLGQQHRGSKRLVFRKQSLSYKRKKDKAAVYRLLQSQKHLVHAEELRTDIDQSYDFPNAEKYIEANSLYLGELVYEAEQYIAELKTSI